MAFVYFFPFTVCLFCISNQFLVGEVEIRIRKGGIIGGIISDHLSDTETSGEKFHKFTVKQIALIDCEKQSNHCQLHHCLRFSTSAPAISARILYVQFFLFFFFINFKMLQHFESLVLLFLKTGISQSY